MNQFLNVFDASSLYTITYKIDSGEILDVKKHKEFIDSFNIKSNGYLDAIKNNDHKNIDCLTAVTSVLLDEIEVKNSHIINHGNNRNSLILKHNLLEQPVYPSDTSNKLSCHLTSKAFSPTFYTKVFKDILNINTQNIVKTSIFYNDSNRMGISPIHEEIALESSKIPANHLIFLKGNKILIHITEPQYVIPKFYYNILYFDFPFDDFSQAHADMISFNYDEIWVTNENVFNDLKSKVKSRVNIKILRPGLDVQSYLNFKIDKYPEYYEDELKDKFVFSCICADSNRYDIETMIKAYYKSFNKNDDVILKIHIYPLNEEQFSNKSSRVKRYQNIINKLSTSNSPRISFNYGNIKSNDRKTLLSLTDCFILPSRGEGFCQECIEAALMGIDQIIPYHTGLMDILDFYDKNIPTINCPTGLQQLDLVGKLSYIGDYQELTESADFNPAYFNSSFFNFDENSINFIVENMKLKFNDRNYNILHTEKMQQKCIDLYNNEKFIETYCNYYRDAIDVH